MYQSSVDDDMKFVIYLGKIYRGSYNPVFCILHISNMQRVVLTYAML